MGLPLRWTALTSLPMGMFTGSAQGAQEKREDWAGRETRADPAQMGDLSQERHKGTHSAKSRPPTPPHPRLLPAPRLRCWGTQGGRRYACRKGRERPHCQVPQTVAAAGKADLCPGRPTRWRPEKGPQTRVGPRAGPWATPQRPSRPPSGVRGADSQPHGWPGGGGWAVGAGPGHLPTPTRPPLL